MLEGFFSYGDDENGQNEDVENILIFFKSIKIFR
jgi:hypothetical protein